MAGSRRAPSSWGSSESLIISIRLEALRRSALVSLPRPVTGSQPTVAWKPEELQLGLEPLMMSFNTHGLAYCSDGKRKCAGYATWPKSRLTKTGLTKPIGPLPASVRSWLRSVSTEAKMGEAKLVPKMRSSVPLLKMSR